ncbi:hypothetical protein V5O48_011922 [Marasmius crinis-equi]|uniref:F-box domain-containing protein n=1 Tax=Marasmius crinis-equi TaxID=585013 RepID=A0ABR3F4H6_9AGAR
MDPFLIAVSNTISTTQIDELIERHHRAIVALSRKRNTFPTIHRIPDEVLIYIFVWLKDITAHECELSMSVEPSWSSDRPCPTKPKHPIPWLYPSQVCSHWREVSLDCASLWSTIFLNNIYWTEELLRRSKRALLKVMPDPRWFFQFPRSVDVVPRETIIPTLVYQSFLIVARNASNRISNLRIYADAFPFREELKTLDVSSLTSLKTLSIVQKGKETWESHLRVDGSIDNRVPWEITLLHDILTQPNVRLTHLDILGDPRRNWLESSSSTSLTHLRISRLGDGRWRVGLLKHEDVLAMLRGFPSLCELVLNNVMGGSTTARSPNPEEAISLPCLARIEILDCRFGDVVSLLEFIQVTSLATIRVRCSNEQTFHHAPIGERDTSIPSNEKVLQQLNSFISSLARLSQPPEPPDLSKGMSRSTPSSSHRSLMLSINENKLSLAFSRDNHPHLLRKHYHDRDIGSNLTNDVNRKSFLPSVNIGDRASSQIVLRGFNGHHHGIAAFVHENLSSWIQGIERVMLYDDVGYGTQGRRAAEWGPWIQLLVSLPCLRSLALYLGTAEIQGALLEALDVGPLSGVNFSGLKDLEICFPRLSILDTFEELSKFKCATPAGYKTKLAVMARLQDAPRSMEGLPSSARAQLQLLQEMQERMCTQRSRLFRRPLEVLPLWEPIDVNPNSTWSPVPTPSRTVPEVLRARRDHGYRVRNATFVAVQDPIENQFMEEWAKECVDAVDDVSFEREA